MSAENEVREASAQFYAALNSMANGNVGPMVDIWSHSEDVTTMHPIGGREVGWNEVEGPWAQVAGISSSGRVELDDQLIRVSDDIAYELGTERGQATMAGEQISFEQRVTNIYRREGGSWKIVHHHTDLSPAMVELLARLQGS
ncbi:MAG: nuclear transport factor 2 family protein [Chloroflexota bacterium]|jgi:ketosteroid isomerase-like protein